MKLTLERMSQYSRNEVGVVRQGSDGKWTPVPFKWIDDETIEVDDCLGEVISVQISPKPRGERL